MTEVPSVLRIYINGLKSHDVQKIASTVSEDLAFISPGRSLNKTQFLEMLQALYTAFPDWSYDHDPPEATEEVIAIQWRQCGTHTGTFALPGLAPVQATERKVTIPEQYFSYKIRDDQIVEIRPDPVPGGAPRGILEQIGITKAEL